MLKNLEKMFVIQTVTYKNIYSLLAVILLSFLVFACSEFDNPAGTKPDLSIKSETKWNCDLATGEKELMIYKRNFLTDGKIERISDFFDNGNISKLSEFEYFSNYSFEQISFFNKTGILDSMILCSYVYDNGTVILKHFISQSGDTLNTIYYDYDNLGNIRRIAEYSSNGNLNIETIFKYTYNNAGNVVERLINPGQNGTYAVKDSLVYKAKNNTIERITINADGKLQTIVTFIYNNYGKIIKEYSSTPEGRLLNLFEYTYEYY